MLTYIVWEVVILAIFQRLPLVARVLFALPIAAIVGAGCYSAFMLKFQSGSITDRLEPTASVPGVARLGGVRPFAHTATDIAAIVAAVAPHLHDRTVVPMTEAVSLAFLTGLRNVTPYEGLFMMSDCEQQLAIETFERARPFVVTQRAEWETDPASFQVQVRAIVEYFHRHYVPVYDGKWYILLDQKPENTIDIPKRTGGPKC